MIITDFKVNTVNPPGLGARGRYAEAHVTLRNVSPSEVSEMLQLWYHSRLIKVVSEVDQ